MTRSPQHGFTLLEVMVVVVLIGIILTLAVPSVGDGGRRERILREAKRLSALVELVGEEAVLRSSVLGLRIEEQGYGFLLLDGGQWLPVEQDSLLKPRSLESPMTMQLEVEGYAIGLGGNGEEEDEEAPKPQVIFLPGGERTPFELALRYETDDSGYLLQAPAFGPVERRRLEGGAR